MQENRLTEEMVRKVVLTWYSGTNEHRPVEDLTVLLADDVEMRYPNTPDTFTGHDAFKRWYADVLGRFFDETHEVQSFDITLDGNSATALVVVRWEWRSWTVGAARSVYQAVLSRQRIEVGRSPKDGRVLIRKKIVETFEKTAPIFGVGG